jgi:uncharacterized membrane protein required for colicin V production
MSILDVILLVALLAFTIAGFWVGLVRTLGHLAAFIGGLLAAFNFYSQLAGWLQGLIGGNLLIYKTISLIVLFGAANRLIVFIFWLIEKVIIVPFLGIINRLIGALLALVGGVLLSGLILHFLLALPVINQLFTAPIGASRAAQILLDAAGLILPLLPAALRQIPALF